MRKVIIFNREVGKYRDIDNCFIKDVNYADHFFRKYQSWGISSSVLLSVYQNKCPKIILVVTKPNGEKYSIWTTPTTWIKNGTHYQHENYEKQTLLHIFHFRTD